MSIEKDDSYEFLYKWFKKKDMQERYESMACRANAFIESQKLENLVYLDRTALDITVLDYFTDIARLKEFEKIKFVNKNKITSYMAYWWLRRKPLQIKGSIEEKKETKERLVYINEEFVFSLFFKDIMDNLNKTANDKKEFEDFEKHLLYHLKYRPINPQNFELMLMAMNTGIILGKGEKAEKTGNNE